jgi:hypothetical protein
MSFIELNQVAYTSIYLYAMYLPQVNAADMHGEGRDN